FRDSRPGSTLSNGSLAQWRSAMNADANSTSATFSVSATGHLPAGSPAIDRGQALAEVPDDIDGQLRGSSYDIGADEATNAAPPPPAPPPPAPPPPQPEPEPEPEPVPEPPAPEPPPPPQPPRERPIRDITPPTPGERTPRSRLRPGDIAPPSQPRPGAPDSRVRKPVDLTAEAPAADVEITSPVADAWRRVQGWLDGATR